MWAASCFGLRLLGAEAIAHERGRQTVGDIRTGNRGDPLAGFASVEIFRSVGEHIFYIEPILGSVEDCLARNQMLLGNDWDLTIQKWNVACLFTDSGTLA